MDIHDLLQRVAQGRLSVEDAARELRFAPFTASGEGVCLDGHRGLRTGVPEVVFGSGKSEAQLERAVQGLAEQGASVLVTKLSPGQGEALHALFPEGKVHPQAGLFTLGADLSLTPPWPEQGEALVLSAGASDLPVALEAYATAQYFGLTAGLVSDVGVAGLHRLLPHLQACDQARVLIVVAGMEGALPSVVAGLTDKPVIAVPTSVGYGVSFQGVTALLGMLSSCAPGVAVVNIDNGFGAAAMARKLCHLKP